MCLTNCIAADKLDDGFVLAPDRYNPNREVRGEPDGVSIGELAEIVRDRRTASQLDDEQAYLVINTSNADRGFVRVEYETVAAEDVGSTKFVVRPGDVIISRLRPYLRQVAYVDPLLAECFDTEVEILCSTEFYVLRARDDQDSIAFLAPYLLSQKCQGVFKASQEGGTHPRFREEVLLEMPVPERLLDASDSVSEKVRHHIDQIRRSEVDLRELSRPYSA